MLSNLINLLLTVIFWQLLAKWPAVRCDRWRLGTSTAPYAKNATSDPTRKYLKMSDIAGTLIIIKNNNKGDDVSENIHTDLCGISSEDRRSPALLGRPGRTVWAHRIDNITVPKVHVFWICSLFFANRAVFRADRVGGGVKKRVSTSSHARDKFVISIHDTKLLCKPKLSYLEGST